MFVDDLNIGVKGFSVVVRINLAESIDDCRTIAKGSDDYVVACFNRAHRINVQERSGARETVRKLTTGKSASMLKEESFISSVRNAAMAAIGKWVPGARRAAVHEAPTIKLPAMKGKTISIEQLLAAAQAAGVKLEVSE